MIFSGVFLSLLCFSFQARDVAAQNEEVSDVSSDFNGVDYDEIFGTTINPSHFSMGEFTQIGDDVIIRDEATCSQIRGEVAHRIARYRNLLDDNLIRSRDWHVFDTFDQLCRIGGRDGEEGFSCGCVGKGPFTRLECRWPETWNLFRLKVTLDSCVENCKCPQRRAGGAADAAKGDLVPSEEAAAAGGKLAGGAFQQGGPTRKSGWVRAWRKTKKICGIKRCHGLADCQASSCSSPTVCRVIPTAPGFYESLGACLVSNTASSAVGFGRLGFSSSGLGRRAVQDSRDEGLVEDEACPCNSTYVSTRCCWAEGGLVWEEAGAKLGQLTVAL